MHPYKGQQPHPYVKILQGITSALMTQLSLEAGCRGPGPAVDAVQ